MFIYESKLYTVFLTPQMVCQMHCSPTACYFQFHLATSRWRTQEVLGDLNLAANCVAKYILEDGSLLTGHHDDLNLTEIFDLKDSS